MAQTVTTYMQVYTVNGSACRRPCNHINTLVLAANTAKSYTCPASAGYILVRSNATVYYRFGTGAGGFTATVPSGDVTDGEGSAELRDNLYMTPGEVISLVSPTAAIVTFENFVGTSS